MKKKEKEKKSSLSIQFDSGINSLCPFRLKVQFFQGNILAITFCRQLATLFELKIVGPCFFL